MGCIKLDEQNSIGSRRCERAKGERVDEGENEHAVTGWGNKGAHEREERRAGKKRVAV